MLQQTTADIPRLAQSIKSDVMRGSHRSTHSAKLRTWEHVCHEVFRKFGVLSGKDRSPHAAHKTHHIRNIVGSDRLERQTNTAEYNAQA